MALERTPRVLFKERFFPELPAHAGHTPTAGITCIYSANSEAIYCLSDAFRDGPARLDRYCSVWLCEAMLEVRPQGICFSLSPRPCGVPTVTHFPHSFTTSKTEGANSRSPRQSKAKSAVDPWEQPRKTTEWRLINGHCSCKDHEDHEEPTDLSEPSRNKL